MGQAGFDYSCFCPFCSSLDWPINLSSSAAFLSTKFNFLRRETLCHESLRSTSWSKQLKYIQRPGTSDLELDLGDRSEEGLRFPAQDLNVLQKNKFKLVV